MLHNSIAAVKSERMKGTVAGLRLCPDLNQLAEMIRELAPLDDVELLTEMLHRAYAPLAALGLRYSATHQSPEVTRRRLDKGYSLVAEVEGRDRKRHV